MRPPPAIPVDDLLQHADFVRELARELCADAATADDLAQDVWLRTLVHPPSTHDSPRGWFATIARRLATNLRRGDHRRLARERATTAPEAPLTPEAVLAAEQTRERLVHAVLGLAEPYRQVLLLRFWEGLEPREIARRLRVPGATVRTHLARGLERLRARFDAEHGGDRTRWLAALAPWLPPRLPGTGTAVASLLLMKKLVVASLLLVLAAFAGWSLWPSASVAPGSPEARGIAAAHSTAPAAPAGDERDPALPRTDVGSAAAIDVAREPRVFPAVRGRGRVLGRVVDAHDTAIAGAKVELTPTLGNLPPGIRIDDDRSESFQTLTQEDGTFGFEGVLEGPVQLRASHADRTTRDTCVVSQRTDQPPRRLQLDAWNRQGDNIRVLVMDDADRPQVGALVQFFASRRDDDAAAADEALRNPLFEGRTDDAGLAAMRGLGARGTGVVTARTQDGRVGMAVHTREIQDDPETYVVTVRAPGSLRLRFTGVPEHIVDAAVTLHAMSWFSTWSASNGQRRDFPWQGEELVIPDLAAGLYGISLRGPGAGAHGCYLGAEAAGDLPNPTAMPCVRITAGTESERVVAFVPGGAIHGRVVAGLHPVSGARVRAVLVPSEPQGESGGVAVLGGVPVWRPSDNGPACVGSCTATTDAQGQYELRGLPPGTWRVEIATPSLAFDRRLRVPVEAERTVELRHDLAPAGVLQVASLDAGLLGVAREGSDEPTMLASAGRNFVTFAGLAPGRYAVKSFHFDPNIAPVALGVGEVTAGRTTWLDLRAACVRAVVRGQVMQGAHPVRDARVLFGGLPATGNDDGTFRLELGFVPDFRSLDLVVHRGMQRWQFRPVAPQGATAIDTDLQLGDQFVAVEAVGANGQAAAAKVQYYWAADAAVTATNATLLGASGELSARGVARLGPLPTGRLEGHFEFDGDLRIAFSTTVPAAAPMRVVDPARATVTLRLTAAGHPAANAWVHVRTWLGAGPAPATDAQFRGPTAIASARTDDRGVAVLRVAAGDVLVCVLDPALAAKDVPKRLHLDAGSAIALDLVFP